jgi:hypothetical protein
VKECCSIVVVAFVVSLQWACGFDKANPLWQAGSNGTGSSTGGSSTGLGTSGTSPGSTTETGASTTGTGGRTTDAGNSSGAGDSTGALTPEGIVAWYRFDADRTGFVVDSGPNMLHATCTTCIDHVAGIEGQAGDFSMGTDLSVGDDPALRPDTLTIAAWIRLDTLPALDDRGHILSKPFGTTNLNSFEMWVLTAGGGTELLFEIESDTVSGYVTTPYENLDWHHVAGTCDGAMIRLYLDGMLVDETASGPPTYDANPMLIGHDIDDGVPHSWLDGQIDDLRLYDRALPPSEIAALATP